MSNPPEEPVWDVLFYDGDCGLCHRAVAWVLRKDAEAGRFRFSPLRGQYIQSVLSESERAALPDTLVVRTVQGRTLMRSAALAYILERLGHTTTAAVLRGIPRPLADLAYRLVAAVRHGLLARPSRSCPATPPHLKARFLP